MRVLTLFFYLPFLFLFVNYNYYSVFALISIILIYNNYIDIKLSNYKLKFVVMFYFIIRFFSAFDSRVNILWKQMSQKNYSLEGKFIDIQSVFWNLNCNSQNTGDYQIFGSDQVLSCPHKVSYGPFFDIFGFKNNPSITTFIFVFLAFFLLYLFFSLELKGLSPKNSYIFTLIFLSPPANFLIERMNFDLIVFITIYLIYTKIENIYIKNTLIFILATMKYYPIFLLLGSIVYKTINKKFRNLKIDVFFLASYLYLYFISYKNLELNTPVLPIRPDRTFGILSEALNFQNAFNFSPIYVYILLFFLLLVLTFLFWNQNAYTHLFEIEKVHNILIMFILLSFLANYDYRLGFLVIICPYVIKQSNRVLFYSFIIFIFSSPGLMHSYSNLFQLVENYSFVYIDFPFYFLLSQLISEYFKFVLKKVKQ